VCSGNHGCNLVKPKFDQSPPPLAQYDDGNLAIDEILLVPDVSICRDEDVKTSGLGCIEQFAVSEPVPSARSGFLDIMRD
jgi:hypothetical protein